MTRLSFSGGGGSGMPTTDMLETEPVAEDDDDENVIEAIEPESHSDKNTSRAIHIAADNDSPYIKSILLSCPDSTRFLYDNPAAPRTGDVAIHLAARKGNMNALHAILGSDKDCVLIKNDAGDSALHCAIKKGHFAAVQAICSRAPDSAKVQGEEGNLPLHDALSDAAHFQDSPQIVAVVLAAYPEAAGMTSDEGLLPIHYAAMSGSASGIRTIFAYRFDTLHERENTEGMNALDFALDGWSGACMGKPCEEDEMDIEGGTESLLSVAWRHNPDHNKKSYNKGQFKECVEILLMSTLCNRPILSPLDESDGIPKFAPLHGAVVATPPTRTWKKLLCIYGPDYGKSLDDLGHTPMHTLLLTPKPMETPHIMTFIQDLFDTNPDCLLQRDRGGMIPLHAALAAYRPVEVIELLVKLRGSTLEESIATTGNNPFGGLFPFQLAAVNGCSIDIIYSLLRSQPSCAVTFL